MRSPCLIEDEGRPEFIQAFESTEEAEAWINRQEGYFTSSDYYIYQPSLIHKMKGTKS